MNGTDIVIYDFDGPRLNDGSVILWLLGLKI